MYGNDYSYEVGLKHNSVLVWIVTIVKRVKEMTIYNCCISILSDIDLLYLQNDKTEAYNH